MIQVLQVHEDLYSRYCSTRESFENIICARKYALENKLVYIPNYYSNCIPKRIKL